MRWHISRGASDGCGRGAERSLGREAAAAARRPDKKGKKAESSSEEESEEDEEDERKKKHKKDKKSKKAKKHKVDIVCNCVSVTSCFESRFWRIFINFYCWRSRFAVRIRDPLKSD